MDSLAIHFFYGGVIISKLMINEQIRDREVRLIGPDGEQLGIMSAREAQAKAYEADLDLVKVAPNAKPPVCNIIDYGKYRYELVRKEKEAKKKQKTIEIKEIRMSPNIEVFGKGQQGEGNAAFSWTGNGAYSANASCVG